MLKLGLTEYQVGNWPLTAKNSLECYQRLQGLVDAYNNYFDVGIERRHKNIFQQDRLDQAKLEQLGLHVHAVTKTSVLVKRLEAIIQKHPKILSKQVLGIGLQQLWQIVKRHPGLKLADLIHLRVHYLDQMQKEIKVLQAWADQSEKASAHSFKKMLAECLDAISQAQHMLNSDIYTLVQCQLLSSAGKSIDPMLELINSLPAKLTVDLDVSAAWRIEDKEISFDNALSTYLSLCRQAERVSFIKDVRQYGIECVELRGHLYYKPEIFSRSNIITKPPRWTWLFRGSYVLYLFFQNSERLYRLHYYIHKYKEVGEIIIATGLNYDSLSNLKIIEQSLDSLLNQELVKCQQLLKKLWPFINYFTEIIFKKWNDFLMQTHKQVQQQKANIITAVSKQECSLSTIISCNNISRDMVEYLSFQATSIGMGATVSHSELLKGLRIQLGNRLVNDIVNLINRQDVEARKDLQKYIAQWLEGGKLSESNWGYLLETDVFSAVKTILTSINQKEIVSLHEIIGGLEVFANRLNKLDEFGCLVDELQPAEALKNMFPMYIKNAVMHKLMQCLYNRCAYIAWQKDDSLQMCVDFKQSYKIIKPKYAQVFSVELIEKILKSKTKSLNLTGSIFPATSCQLSELDGVLTQVEKKIGRQDEISEKLSVSLLAYLGDPKEMNHITDRIMLVIANQHQLKQYALKRLEYSIKVEGAFVLATHYFFENLQQLHPAMLVVIRSRMEKIFLTGLLTAIEDDFISAQQFDVKLKNIQVVYANFPETDEVNYQLLDFIAKVIKDGKWHVKYKIMIEQFATSSQKQRYRIFWIQNILTDISFFQQHNMVYQDAVIAKYAGLFWGGDIGYINILRDVIDSFYDSVLSCENVNASQTNFLTTSLDIESLCKCYAWSDLYTKYNRVKQHQQQIKSRKAIIEDMRKYLLEKRYQDVVMLLEKYLSKSSSSLVGVNINKQDIICVLLDELKPIIRECVWTQGRVAELEVIRTELLDPMNKFISEDHYYKSLQWVCKNQVRICSLVAEPSKQIEVQNMQAEVILDFINDENIRVLQAHLLRDRDKKRISDILDKLIKRELFAEKQLLLKIFSNLVNFGEYASREDEVKIRSFITKSKLKCEGNRLTQSQAIIGESSRFFRPAPEICALDNADTCRYEKLLEQSREYYAWIIIQKKSTSALEFRRYMGFVKKSLEMTLPDLKTELRSEYLQMLSEVNVHITS